MPSRGKRRHNGTSLLPVQCSGCGSDCQIEITNIAEKSIHDIECERFSFTVCGICYPAVAALESLEAPDNLTVFTSHLNPSVVQFSSHPDVIPVSSFLSVCTSASTSTTVRTATIKSDSNSSHPNFQSNEKLDQNEVVDQNQTDDRNQIIKACFSTARSWFDSCDSVIIIAGAGMSVESGLKTFRYELSGQSEHSDYSKYSQEKSVQLGRQLEFEISADLDGTIEERERNETKKEGAA